MVDVVMDDSNRLGKITLAAGSFLRFRESAASRLLCDTIDNSGTILVGSASVPHPAQVTIDLCGAIPITSGNSGGGALVRGASHIVNTATGNNGTTNDNYGLSRGFLVNPGGVLKLYGAQAPIATRLNAHYSSGTSITVADFVTAPAGATVLVSPSGFYNASTRTEVRTLAVAAVNTKTLVLNSALGYARWGLMQYMTDNGMSLTDDGFTLYDASTNTTGMRTRVSQNQQIDQRAFVCVIAPTVQVRGYDAGNTSLASSGFGFHGMSMGLTSTTVLKNVGLENYGQLGLLARYGWHFHIPSYNPATGAYRTDGVAGSAAYTQVGAGTANYPAGNAVLDGVSGLKGFNRFINLHGCRGVKVTNCIGHDSAGHTFMEEDGSEEENEVSNCVALAPRDPGSSYRIKLHDIYPFGFWFGNMWNTHTNNWGVDTPGGPWWNALAVGKVSSSSQYGCLGLSSLVPIAPAYSRMGVWDGNSGLCCQGYAKSDNGTNQDDGDAVSALDSGGVQARRIAITTDGLAFSGYSNTNEVTNGFAAKNARLYKMPGYSNQVSSSGYEDWRVADVTDFGIQGNANFGDSNGMILIRETLNHESHYLNSYVTIGFATYHGLLSHRNVTADGWSGGGATTDRGNHGALQRRAVMSSWESYTDPVHTFSKNNSGWRLRNSRGIWQTPPWHLVQATSTYDGYTGTAANWPKYTRNGAGEQRGWSLGVQFDKYGTMGQGPTTSPVPNTHIVFNQPFFTSGAASPVALEDNAESARTTTPYGGFLLLYYGFGTGNQYGSGLDESLGSTELDNRRTYYRTTFQRVDSSRTVISNTTWEMPDSRSSQGGQILMGQHMGAVPANGYATVRWPDNPKETMYLGGTMYGQSVADNPNVSSGDVTYWGIEWANGAAVAGAKIGSTPYTARASFAALQAATEGYWQDTTNNLVWLKTPFISSGYFKIWASGYA